MRIALTIIAVLLLIVRAWAQDVPTAPAAWTPVDQTVSDYDPTQVSQRQLDAGIGVFSRQTLFEPTQPATWSASGLPAVGGQYGLTLPSNYIYRAPGTSAMVIKPAYVVKTGPEPEDFAFNQVPVREDLYLTIESPGMIYNLIPQLVEPDTRAPRDDWLDTRVDGRLPTINLSLPTGAAMRGDGTDYTVPTDPRETDGWVDGATYFQRLREGR